MRFLVALCMLLAVTYGAQANEPFGLVDHRPTNLEVFRLQVHFSRERGDLVARIAEEVRQHSTDTWLAWTNQLVDFANVGDCTPTAVLKFQVLLALGFSRNDLRLVVGSEIGYQDNHMIVAVYGVDGWRVLDNRHLVRTFAAPLDSQIKKTFRALYALN